MTYMTIRPTRAAWRENSSEGSPQAEIRRARASLGPISRNGHLRSLALATLIVVAPAISTAEVVWNGDFSTGDFTQWHHPQNPDSVRFFLVPEYGRPLRYSPEQSDTHTGNGDLLSLVARTERTVGNVKYPAGPTRGRSEYSAKFTVKNSAEGTEPDDCDPATNCTNRRSQLQGESILGHNGFHAIPHLSTRWISLSIYVPTDFEIGSGGWGPTITGLKATGSPVSGFFNLGFSKDGTSWEIFNRWTGVENVSSWDDLPWWQQMYYTASYPRASSSEWSDLRDFPSAESQAALGTVNKGGWTDWIIYLKHDPRTLDEGGQGRLRVWKRDGEGAWVEVLDIRPKTTTRGGRTFAHGIGFNYPNRGYGMNTGLYMDVDRVWNNRDSMSIYLANMKIGDANSTFQEMSPDGSAPGHPDDGVDAPPRPPEVAPVE